MLDGPKVSSLERWASLLRAGKGTDTSSVWSLAAVCSEGSSQRAEYWELDGQRDSWWPGAGAMSICRLRATTWTCEWLSLCHWTAVGLPLPASQQMGAEAWEAHMAVGF